MSVQNQIIRNSGRAISNALGMVGVKLVDEYLVSRDKVSLKEIGVDSLVLGTTTLVSGVANSMVSKVVKLPNWVMSIEASYGLDLVNLLIYVVAIKLVDMKMWPGGGRPLVKIILEAVSALVMGSYFIQPINNLLPIGMKA